MQLPLQGIRVIDLTSGTAGPLAAMRLAEFGAAVIKVEAPGEGDPTRATAKALFMAVNRGKQSLALDIASEDGRAAVRKLALDADVLLEDGPSGRLEGLGLGYEELKASNARLVFCSISPFGEHGPLRAHDGRDFIVQAESGIMGLNGNADGPPLALGVPVADIAAAMFTVQGILAALFRRGASGAGGRVDICKFDAVLALSAYYAANYFMSGKPPTRIGSGHHSAVPYGVFATGDGHVIIAVFGDKFWVKIVEELGAPQLATDPRFATGDARLAHRQECIAALEALLSTWTSEALVARMSAAGVPCSMVREIGAALQTDHARHWSAAGQFQDPALGTVRALRTPVKFEGQWCPMRAPPALGAS